MLIPITYDHSCDGDTIVADIHLPLDLTLRRQVIRIMALDTPELNSAERQQALNSKHALHVFMQTPKAWIVSETVTKDRWGRWVADVLVQGDDEPVSVAGYMIASGFGTLRPPGRD